LIDTPEKKGGALFSIGYANLSQAMLLDYIQQQNIQAVVDVRSMPYSQRWQAFNRDRLQARLIEEHIHYVFLGDLCGARIEDATVYSNGVLNYAAVQKNTLFQKGLIRLKTGLENYRILLMCAEKDPLNCHRFLLICRPLASCVAIQHIRHDGSLESQCEIEERMLSMHRLEQATLFYSPQERLEQAYNRQHQHLFSR